MHNDYADRKNGRKPVEYLHPDAEEILGDTYGLMIYQEGVMRIAQKFAGYSLAEADNLRKACLPAGTRMLTKSRGYVPIEQVMALRRPRVHTIDTTSCTSRFEPVDDVWSVGRQAGVPAHHVDRLHDRGDRQPPVPRRGRVAPSCGDDPARRPRRRGAAARRPTVAARSPTPRSTWPRC